MTNYYGTSSSGKVSKMYMDNPETNHLSDDAKALLSIMMLSKPGLIMAGYDYDPLFDPIIWSQDFFSLFNVEQKFLLDGEQLNVRLSDRNLSNLTELGHLSPDTLLEVWENKIGVDVHFIEFSNKRSTMVFAVYYNQFKARFLCEPVLTFLTTGAKLIDNVLYTVSGCSPVMRSSDGRRVLWEVVQLPKYKPCMEALEHFTFPGGLVLNVMGTHFLCKVSSTCKLMARDGQAVSKSGKAYFRTTALRGLGEYTLGGEFVRACPEDTIDSDHFISQARGYPVFSDIVALLEDWQFNVWTQAQRGMVPMEFSPEMLETFGGEDFYYKLHSYLMDANVRFTYHELHEYLHEAGWAIHNGGWRKLSSNKPASRNLDFDYVEYNHKKGKWEAAQDGLEYIQHPSANTILKIVSSALSMIRGKFAHEFVLFKIVVEHAIEKKSKIIKLGEFFKNLMYTCVSPTFVYYWELSHEFQYEDNFQNLMLIAKDNGFVMPECFSFRDKSGWHVSICFFDKWFMLSKGFRKEKKAKQTLCNLIMDDVRAGSGKLFRKKYTSAESNRHHYGIESLTLRVVRGAEIANKLLNVVGDDVFARNFSRYINPSAGGMSSAEKIKNATVLLQSLGVFISARIERLVEQYDGDILKILAEIEE